MPEPQKINLGISPVPAKSIPLENIPIRTMKDDLKNIGTPNYNPSEMSTPTKPMGNIPPSAPAKPSTSPFLAPKPASATIEPAASKPSPSFAPASSPAPVANPFQRTINPLTQGNVNVDTGQSESSLSLKKAFLIGGGIFLMLAMMAGGYYYWISRQSSEVAVQPEPEVVPAEVPVEVPEAEPEVTPVVAPVFSTDKPNYLILDIKTADSAKIKLEIKDRIDKIIADTKITTPVEFVVSDANFTPLSFKYFAGTFKLTLPVKLIANLEDKFSLFIYNENGTAKLGLLLDAKDEKLAKTQMTQAENLLINQLKPLYLDLVYTIKDKKFSSSQYKDLAIRYNNLVSTTPEISLDYAITGKKLIIGTSKATLRSIYDYLKNATTTAATLETAQPVDNSGE